MTNQSQVPNQPKDQYEIDYRTKASIGFPRGTLPDDRRSCLLTGPKARFQRGDITWDWLAAKAKTTSLPHQTIKGDCITMKADFQRF